MAISPELAALFAAGATVAVTQELPGGSPTGAPEGPIIAKGGLALSRPLASLALAPRWQLLIYPMLDPACDTGSYREFQAGPWPNGEDMRRGWELYGGTPVTAELGAFPKTLLITAGVDALRDEALAFAAGLRARDIAVEAIHYADMPHGFFTQTRLTRSRELINFLAAALAR